jgi:prolycopene isomerase
MGGINLTLTDLAKMSTGDNIKINRQCVLAGYHMSAGGTGTVGEPGYRLVFQQLAEAVCHAGGAVRTQSKVREIVVKDGRVRGVVASGPGGTYEAQAPVVISNVPIQNTFSILPENLFPSAWVAKVKSFWSAGGLCVNFGLRRPLIREACYVPTLLRAAEAGTDSDLFYVYWPTSDETRRKAVLDRVCEAILAFMRATYPRFDQDLKWAVFPVTNFLCGVAPTMHQVGEDKPDVKAPSIEGLYFTGDTVRGWGCAADAAVHAALLCATAVGQYDYMQVVPEFMR